MHYRSLGLLLAALIASQPAIAAKPAAADPALAARGKLVFLKCAACHSIKPGAPAKVGPNLSGVVGRAAASAPGFGYSAALKGLKTTWSDATLDKWLTRPSALAPGTTMVFAGLASADERKAVIAYLKKPVP